MSKKAVKPQVPPKTNAKTCFQKGKSGNPAGRPKRADSNIQLRTQIQVGLPGVIEMLLKKANGGDLQAAKILLERVLPPLKPQLTPAPVQLPEGDTPSQLQFLLEAASQGHIPIEYAAELARIVQLKQIAQSFGENGAIDLPVDFEPEISTDHQTGSVTELTKSAPTLMTITEAGEKNSPSTLTQNISSACGSEIAESISSINEGKPS
jgi:Family of unknown function (DUF5681)